jgi:opine dehydrogenase
MAADLSVAGLKVRLWEHPDFESNIETVRRSREIELTGRSIAKVNGMIGGREGTARIDKVTTSLEEAVRDVSIINFQMPAYADEIVFEELAPHLKEGQNVVLWTGYFRSFRIGHRFGDLLQRKKISLWETNTQPFGSRVKAPGLVEMDQTLGRVFFSQFPRLDAGDGAVGELKEFYPLVELDNVLLISLINPNTLIHPTGSLLNVGRIEHSRGDFYLYREGITPAVGEVIGRLQKEIQSIMGVLSFSLLLNNQEAFWQDIIRAVGMGETIGPRSVESRYITEDVPYSLVPIAQIGEKLGVDVSMTRALVEIGSAVCRQDYWRTGRTLESLGLDRLSAEELTEEYSKRG